MQVRGAPQALRVQLGVVDHGLRLEVRGGGGRGVRVLRVVVPDLRRRVARVGVRRRRRVGVVVVRPGRGDPRVPLLARRARARRLVAVARGQRVHELVGTHPGVVVEVVHL